MVLAQPPHFFCHTPLIHFNRVGDADVIRLESGYCVEKLEESRGPS